MHAQTSFCSTVIDASHVIGVPVPIVDSVVPFLYKWIWLSKFRLVSVLFVAFKYHQTEVVVAVI